MLTQGPAGTERDRRTFLKWMSALGGTLVAAFTVLPAARAFLSRLFARRQPEDWVRLGEASEIDIGLPIKVDFVQTVKDAWVQQRALHDVWVYTDDGETFTVYNGRCTHLGCATTTTRPGRSSTAPATTAGSIPGPGP